MVQLFVDEGGFMWPILFIFIIGFVFVGERLYHLVKGLASNEEFAMDVAATLEKSGSQAAKNLCDESVGPVANLCSSALEKADDGIEAVEKTLNEIKVNEGSIPVYMNFNAKKTDAETIKDSLINQIDSSVMFYDQILNIENEVKPELWCHIGPGNVTAGMVRKSISSKEIRTINSLESLAN